MGVAMSVDIELLSEDDTFMKRLFGKVLSFSEIKKVGEIKTIELTRSKLAPTTVEYLAVMDNRTTDICRSLDGKTWPVGSPDVKVPPLHWNCRSQLLYEGGILQ